MPPSIDTDMARRKQAFRDRFETFRRALNPEVYRRRSAALVQRLRTLPEVAEAETVHVYWPLTSRHEVDIRPLISWMEEQKKQIVLPVVVTFGHQEGQAPVLTHRRFTGIGSLQPNRWGIQEPTGTETVPLEALDLVVVPALAADRKGYRIGYGGGFYDAFLRNLTIPTICPVFAECLVDAVPSDAHDVPVTVIVTEDEVHRPTGNVTSPDPNRNMPQPKQGPH